MRENLQEKRLHAALASEGISAGPIYQTVLHLCRSLRLHGDLLEFGAGTATFKEAQCFACRRKHYLRRYPSPP
jgi:hypothetical protein